MIEAHPLTEYIPERADQDALVMDIAQTGLREPVVLYEGQIIEGRVRYRAALEAGHPNPSTQDWVLLDSPLKDPLDWMVHRHTRTHELTELEKVNLVDRLLPYYSELPGKTEQRLNKATGLSVRKIRVLDWLHGTKAIAPVLAGEKDVLEAGRETGLVSQKHGVALGKSYGHGDKFDEAFTPPKRYLAAWKRKGYEFRHVNPKEATRRLSLIDSLAEELQAMRLDLEKRSVAATLSAPPERKVKQ